MSTIWQHITTRIDKGHQLLAVLVDPEKGDKQSFEKLAITCQQQDVDMILVGGSTMNADFDACIRTIKASCDLPVLIFPGDAKQVSSQADALLFLSLASGRNAEYLMGQQVAAAPLVNRIGLETVGTGYILIESGRQSAVERVSGTLPMSREDVTGITNTALACQMMGMSCIYLEAGSGALHPVPTTVIQSVKQHLNIPVIVGGGLRSTTQIQAAYDAGADIVVVGTFIEESVANLPLLRKSNYTC